MNVEIVFNHFYQKLNIKINKIPKTNIVFFAIIINYSSGQSRSCPSSTVYIIQTHI
jgi:hypothetical protein